MRFQEAYDGAGARDDSLTPRRLRVISNSSPSGVSRSSSTVAAARVGAGGRAGFSSWVVRGMVRGYQAAGLQTLGVVLTSSTSPVQWQTLPYQGGFYVT